MNAGAVKSIEPPDELKHVWDWYKTLAQFRAYKGGPIMPETIESWARQVRIELLPSEFDLLARIDRLAITPSDRRAPLSNKTAQATMQHAGARLRPGGKSNYKPL